MKTDFTEKLDESNPLINRDAFIRGPAGIKGPEGIEEKSFDPIEIDLMALMIFRSYLSNSEPNYLKRIIKFLKNIFKIS